MSVEFHFGRKLHGKAGLHRETWRLRFIEEVDLHAIRRRGENLWLSCIEKENQIEIIKASQRSGQE